MCNLSRTVCTGTSNIRVAKRVTGKRPVSHINISADVRDEPASSSTDRPFQFARQGIG